MVRCHLIRSVKTTAAFILALITLLVMLDIRSWYIGLITSTESSDYYRSSELRAKRRSVFSLPRSANFETDREFLPPPNNSESDGQLDSKNGEKIENHYIPSTEMLPTGESQLPVDNRSLTLAFWGLLNGSTNKNGTFTESSQLPNLWRPKASSSSFLLEQRDDDRILAQLIWGVEATTNLTESTGRSPQMKTIYLPGSFSWWGKSNWQSPHVLEDGDCPGNPGIFRKCSFSKSRDSIDAMITVPTTFKTKNFRVPSNVLNFYFMLESLRLVHVTLRRTKDLLASFYRGSDINTPYGKWVYFDPTVKFKDQDKNYHKGKTKMAAIFTSNCRAKNNRLGFVKELQKYVEVDVFGHCGQKECPKYNQTMCYDMLKRDYFFYLSFENSNCRDYVTEKLFKNAFENDVIPIVLGAHPSDYKAICPDRSYIHVEDFPSPKELAEYMYWLAYNPEEYNSYFRWKGTGTLVDTHFLCRVCAMVHYADIVPPPERKKTFGWNSYNGLCLSSGTWYWSQSMATSSVIVKNWTIVLTVAWHLAHVFM